MTVRVIVTTTINRPTRALELFDAMPDWHLVVVGDQKTPSDFRLTRGTYVTPQMQEKRDPELSEAIGWNCVQRRSFGLLWAHDLGAEVVAVVDDDNVPGQSWGRDLTIGRPTDVTFYETELPAFDPLGATNHPELWHRGFPLPLVGLRDYSHRSNRTIVPDVQADLWDGDPDVDAVCRMEHRPRCTFDGQGFPLAANRMAPFNSQNTFLRAEVLRDYFLFPHVGRMDDIWGAYYLQATGRTVAFGAASVVHERNEHDLIADLRGELLGYEKNLDIVRDLAADPDRLARYVPDRSWRAFQLYRRNFEA